MTEHNNRKIRNLFINKGLQFRIIMTSLIYMILVMIVTIGVVLYPMVRDMMQSSDINIQYKAAQNFLVLFRLMPSMAVLFTFFIFHQLFVTHRILGPLVNFTHAFERIAHADFSRRVTLRKGDYLKKECDALNEMIEGLSGKFRMIAEEHDRVIHVLEETFDNVSDEGIKDNIRKLLTDLKESHEEEGNA